MLIPICILEAFYLTSVFINASLNKFTVTFYNQHKHKSQIWRVSFLDTVIKNEEVMPSFQQIGMLLPLEH